MSVVCHVCQAANPDGAKFCKACGTRLGVPVEATVPAAVTSIEIDEPVAPVPLPAPSPVTVSAPSFPPPVPPRAAAPAMPELPTAVASSNAPALVVAGLIFVLLAAAAWFFLGRGPGKAPAPETPAVQAPPAALAAPAAPPVAIEPAPVTAPPPPAAVVVPPAPAPAPAPAPEAPPKAAPKPAPPPAPRPAAKAPPPPVVAEPLTPPRPQPSLPPVRSTPLPPVTQAVPAAPPVQAGPASPREACGKRVFLAMANCMIQQCATPQFTQHPQCVQMREEDRVRREREQSSGG